MNLKSAENEEPDFRCTFCGFGYINEDHGASFYYNQHIRLDCDCGGSMIVNKVVEVNYTVKEEPNEE